MPEAVGEVGDYEGPFFHRDQTVDTPQSSIRTCVISPPPHREVAGTGSSIGDPHLTPFLSITVTIYEERDGRPGDVCSATDAPEKPLLPKTRYTKPDSLGISLEDRDMVMVLKSGQSSRDRRPLGIERIKQVLDAAPELQKHLPRICVIPLYNSESNLRCFNLNAQSDKNQIKIRNVTAIVAERCCKLWMVNSLEEFKTAFLDIFECHHRAFSKAKALHGEISAGNAMFYRHKTGGIVGCLDGFSSPSASAGDGETSHAEAVPFMALDIIDETKAPMPRFYRHDLESFVYLLVWAGVHFDIRRHAHGATNEILAPWEAHTPSEFIQAYDNK
ncbi:hypothetical protein ARMGADRAFT_1093618, partial [Armillaria gallica]